MLKAKPLFRFLGTVLLGGSVLFLLGCSGGSKPVPEGLKPVTGTVKLDDQPLVGATVMFIPTGTGSATNQANNAGAETNDQGVYEMRSGEGSGVGATPGEYRVVITLLQTSDGSIIKPSRDKSPMQLQLDGAKEKLHANYSDLAFSKLKATVPAGGGTIDFNLKSDGTLPQ